MQRHKSGISVLEVVSALVILTVVVAAAAATVAPLRTQANDQRAEQELRQLNEFSQSFYKQQGRFPHNVNDLVRPPWLTSDEADAADRIRRIRRNYRYAPATGEFSQR